MASRSSLVVNARVHLSGSRGRSAVITNNVEYVATREGADKSATVDDLRRSELAERMGIVGYCAERPGSTALFDQNGVMIATAKDSRSDVAATAATILALLLSLVTTLPVDGIMGTAVSLFILKTAFDIIRDTVGDLLGRPADAETVQQLKTLVLSHDKIEGIHDLILHNYGPGRTIGSCHVEVRSDSNFVEVHEVVDTIEREIEEKLKIMMTIHMDPIELDNETVNHYRGMTQQVVEGLHQKLSLHDFRLVSGENSNRLIFDLLVPFECDYTDEELLEMISGELHRMDQTCSVSITFDRDFTEE